jgi:hypothetical protein
VKNNGLRTVLPPAEAMTTTLPSSAFSSSFTEIVRVYLSIFTVTFHAVK